MIEESKICLAVLIKSPNNSKTRLSGLLSQNEITKLLLYSIKRYTKIANSLGCSLVLFSDSYYWRNMVDSETIVVKDKKSGYWNVVNFAGEWSYQNGYKKLFIASGDLLTIERNDVENALNKIKENSILTSVSAFGGINMMAGSPELISSIKI